MAFAVDFNRSSLQMGNIEPRLKQKLAVKALLLGKYGFGKTVIYESFVRVQGVAQ